jgi:L-threonylcarbamoyladenylate synthase
MLVGSRDPAVVAILSHVLGRGGIAVAPCDTIYGLLGIAPEAEERLREIKGREEGRAFLQLIASPDWLARFTDMRLPDGLEKLWPGALTLIFPARSGGSVALRLPDDGLLLAVMKRLERPLYSTSVNVSGESELWQSKRIIVRFAGRVDLFVDAGDLPGRQPSTILDVTGRPFRLLRQGALRLPAGLLEE